MGKLPIRTYEYTKSGEFVTSYFSMSDARQQHYSDYEGVYPLFVDDDYHVLPNSNILCKQRVGREGIREYNKRKASPYLTENWSKAVLKQKPISVVNVDGDEVARFANMHVAVHITGKTYNQLKSYLQTDKTRDLLIWQTEESET